MPRVTPSHPRKMAAVSLRSSFACPQPGISNEWKKAGSGLSRCKESRARGRLTGVTTACVVSCATSGLLVTISPRASHPRRFRGRSLNGNGPLVWRRLERVAAGEKWRERVGIEPTGAAEGVSVAVLKTGRVTRPDPLPEGQRGGGAGGRELARLKACSPLPSAP